MTVFVGLLYDNRWTVDMERSRSTCKGTALGKENMGQPISCSDVANGGVSGIMAVRCALSFRTDGCLILEPFKGNCGSSEISGLLFFRDRVWNRSGDIRQL